MQQVGGVLVCLFACLFEVSWCVVVPTEPVSIVQARTASRHYEGYDGFYRSVNFNEDEQISISCPTQTDPGQVAFG